MKRQSLEREKERQAAELEAIKKRKREEQAKVEAELRQK